MKTPARILALVAALVAAISLSVLGTGTAALAIPGPIVPVPPPFTLIQPQLTVTVAHNLIQPGGPQSFTVVGKYTDGSALSGKIVVTLDRHDGTAPALIYTATNLPGFVTGVTQFLTAAPIGDETIIANFTPSKTAVNLTADSSASFQVRALGPDIAVVTGPAVAGTPTTVKSTITVPFAGHPIGGRVSIQIDSLGEQASCLPTPVSPTVVSCATSLPASLSATKHALTAIWSGSPSFITAVYAGSITIVQAPAKPKSGSTGSTTSKKTTTSPAPTSSVTAIPAPTATSSATAVAAVPQSDSGSTAKRALPITNTSSTIQSLAGIAIAILLVVFLAIAALVTVAIIRVRRTRAA